MTVAEFILLAIVVVLFWLGLRLGSRLEQVSEELMSLRMLNLISQHLYGIADFTQGVRNRASMERERMEGIVRIYADYLQQTEGLTEEQALLKARYMEENFTSWLVNRSDYGFFRQWRPRHTYTEEFESSDTFARDIAKQDESLTPYDLFAALWFILRKEEYTPGAFLTTGPSLIGIIRSDKFRDYDSFVKRKAIIGRLLRMRLLEEAPPGSNGRIRYRLVQQDIEKLRSSIYNGEGHDDHFFEERYQKGDLLQVLVKDRQQ